MKKVCVVTGSRADYGLLRCVMAGLRMPARCCGRFVVWQQCVHFSLNLGH